MGLYEVTTTGGTYQVETEEPGVMAKAASNIVPDIKDIGQGLKSMATGPTMDILSGDVASAMPKIAKEGMQFWQNPAQNAATMARPLTHPVEYFEEHPVQQTLNAVGALAAGRGLMAPKEAPMAQTPKTPLEAPPMAKPVMPEIPPGAKTGDPHALFAYRDKFGPGGAERNVYNIYGDPNHPTLQKGGWGSSVDQTKLQELGIPVKGKQAGSTFEPLEEAPAPEAPPTGTPGGAKGVPPSPKGPLDEVNEYLSSKYKKVNAQGGLPEKVAKYLQEESRNLGAKDLGLQGRQIQSMGQGFEGLKKAEALVDYARDKGYFDPKLTDVARKEMIQNTLETSGRRLGAMRDIAGKRGAPPVEAMKQAVKTALENQYGIDAPTEITKVLTKIDKAEPTFSGMSDLATDLNKAKTPMQKMGQHPGPTTDAANIISRMNNDAIRGVLKPEEAQVYTQDLRDFGAHKKLEQAVAGAQRRGMAARSNQRGILGRLWQEALDRGGYRMAGNIADRTAKGILKEPGRVRTLPQFFEELGHHADDVLDETFDIQGMAHGGVVGMEGLNDFLSQKYATKGE